MRLHILLALALFAFGGLDVWAWLRDRWRSRRDDLVDRHPQAVALRALAERTPAPAPPPLHIVLSERLVRREIVADCELFDLDATWAGEGR